METAIVLTHRPTGLVAQASERRSQAENLAMALSRLRVILAISQRTDRGGQTSPSELWRSRCPRGRIVVNPEHDDFPPLLAEALDVLTTCGMDVKGAAERLACTPSQLTKFLQHEPRALAQVNHRRQELGLSPLR